MVLQSKELYGDAVPVLPNLRAFPAENGIAVGTLAALGADALVANLTPLQYASGTGFHSVWSAGTDEVSTITANATAATAGDFTLTVDGATTAVIAFDATAADVQAALEALPNVSPGDVVGVATTGADLGEDLAVVTLTWGGLLGGRDIDLTATMGGLTGNEHVLAEAVAGAGSGDAVDALLWAPDEKHQGLLAGETHIQVFKIGIVHAADIPLPAGEAQGDLDVSLKEMSLRQKGLVIQGLAGVA